MPHVRSGHTRTFAAILEEFGLSILGLGPQQEMTL
jgi:hypothetical protein